MKKPTIYFASKTHHAPEWRQIRAAGIDVVSSWIDEAEAGQSIDLADLSSRCISEPARADYTVLYSEGDEHLKFALAEVGAALAFGRRVFVIGCGVSVSPTMLAHPLVTICDSIVDAIGQIHFDYLSNQLNSFPLKWSYEAEQETHHEKD